MLKRVYDATRINEILNHPKVWPYAVYGEQDYIDMTEVIKDKQNVFLVNESGGFIYQWMGEGIYSVHTQFLPEGRGKPVFKAAKESVDYIFNNTDCEMIMAKIPAYNRASKMVARRTGFTFSHTKERVWPQHGKLMDVDYFYLHKSQWNNLNKD